MIGKLQKSGFTIFVLFVVVGVISITAFSISQLVGQITSGSVRHSESLVAQELAEAGIKKALWDIKNALATPLVTPERPSTTQVQKVNEGLLELMDIERAREWQKSYSFEADDLIPGGSVTIYMEILNVSATPFSSFLSPLDKIPPYLEPYHIKGNMEEEHQLGKAPLGGWKGSLRIRATGKFKRSQVAVEEWHHIHMVDVTAPASDHTLFIESEEREYLNEGQFILSNLTVPDAVKNEILLLAGSLSETLNIENDQGNDNQEKSLESVHKLNQKVSGMMGGINTEEALKLAFNLTKSADDSQIKSTLDRIVLSLDPRDWGKVRTNGALFVQLPFFATDDIINYFVDSSPSSRRRPEVGFIGCQNRLHDPYLSIYTLFEGRIYKSFRRLKPLALGPSEKPQNVPPQRYTINTKMNYPRIRPKEQIPSNLNRLVTKAGSFAQKRADHPMKLKGTKDLPIDVTGITLSTHKISIEGVFTGVGIIVSNSNLLITGDITPLNKEKDRLSLVAPNGTIILDPKEDSYRINAALYAKNGLTGMKGQHAIINGNLVVNKLNRDKMPGSFTCNYNSALKSHMGDNIVSAISKTIILIRN
jgi:hypothetical protein